MFGVGFIVLSYLLPQEDWSIQQRQGPLRARKARIVYLVTARSFKSKTTEDTQRNHITSMGNVGNVYTTLFVYNAYKGKQPAPTPGSSNHSNSKQAITCPKASALLLSFISSSCVVGPRDNSLPEL